MLCILRWRWIQKWSKKNITFFSIHRVDSSRLLFLPTVTIPLFEFNFFGPKKPRKEKNYNTLLYSIHELKIVTFFNFYVIPKNIYISLRVDSRIQIQFFAYTRKIDKITTTNKTFKLTLKKLAYGKYIYFNCNSMITPKTRKAKKRILHASLIEIK